MNQYIDASTDAECLALLAELDRVYAMARALSERFDHEHIAVGKFWGVIRGLEMAIARADAEVGREES